MNPSSREIVGMLIPFVYLILETPRMHVLRDTEDACLARHRFSAALYFVCARPLWRGMRRVGTAVQRRGGAAHAFFDAGAGDGVRGRGWHVAGTTTTVRFIIDGLWGDVPLAPMERSGGRVLAMNTLEFCTGVKSGVHRCQTCAIQWEMYCTRNNSL